MAFLIVCSQLFGLFETLSDVVTVTAKAKIWAKEIKALGQEKKKI